jgi:8-oxo-dGTP pyrophosphatase MutT (NUDIX family)
MDVRVRCIGYHNEKIIMIHRISPKRPDGYYIFPGGGVDPGESPEQACVREMLEETNLVVTPVKLLGIQFHHDSNGDHCQMYYYIKIIWSRNWRGVCGRICRGKWSAQPCINCATRSFDTQSCATCWNRRGSHCTWWRNFRYPIFCPR